MKQKIMVVFLLACLLVPAFSVPVFAEETIVAAAQTTINLNQASVADLETLTGIGPALAERIVTYRDAHGPFENVDQLVEVKGIGAAKLAKFRQHLTLK